MEAITSQQCYGELAMDAITLTFWALWMLTTVTAVARCLAISPLRWNLKVMYKLLSRLSYTGSTNCGA
jgi:hypothetical protein